MSDQDTEKSSSIHSDEEPSHENRRIAATKVSKVMSKPEQHRESCSCPTERRAVRSDRVNLPVEVFARSSQPNGSLAPLQVLGLWVMTPPPMDAFWRAASRPARAGDGIRLRRIMGSPAGLYPLPGA